MATPNMERYMTRSARSFLPARRPMIYMPGRRATMDPTLGKKAAAGAPLASRQVPASIQETGPEAMTITDGEASTQPQMVTETQQPIESRGESARYMIQGGGPRIDLSFLVPERVNPNYDPNKAIGGENVPYQESKGIGGFFRRLLGDESNRMNIEAQQAQGAEWREAEKEALKEERLLNRIREADKPTQRRFEEAAAARKGELEAERVTRATERAEDRADRLARETAEARRLAQEREDRLTQWREENALKDASFGQNQLQAGRLSMTGLPGGGLAILDPRSGAVNIVNPGTPGFGTIPAVPPSTRQVYPPVKAPVNTGGAQVNRNDGSVQGAGGTADTMGGPVPPAPENQNTALFPTMGRALGETAKEAVTTVTDPLRAVGTDIYKALFSSGAQQDPEVLKRIREREGRPKTQPRFNVPLGY